MEAAAHLQYALFYAGLGWQVFPIHSIVDVDQCSCGDGGCGSKGKHPITTNGLKAATDDEDQIRAWWDAHPDANIGVATGPDSNLWVTDIDLRDDGANHFTEFCEGRELVTVEQRTGSGGRHLVFVWDDSAGEIRNRTNVLPGVDVRGEGGYIIVPPSNHLSGMPYGWLEGRDPATVEPALAPAWLLELVLSERGAVPGAPQRRAAALNPALLVGALPAREVRSIRSALAAIDPNCDHETWFRVGMALQSTGAGEQAFALWDEWSSGACRMRGSGKAPVYPGAAALRKRWTSFGRRENEVRISTLFWAAQDAGWQGTFEEDAEGGVREVQMPPAASTPAAGTPMPPPGLLWADPEWIWGRNAPPVFPIEHAFPERLWWLREWIKALSWTFQIPTDFPATMAVAMACGAIGGKYCVTVPRVQWREPAALWVVCAMPSGMGKSLAFDPLVKPFREFESSLDEHRERAEFEARLRVADLQVKSAERELQRKASAAASDPFIAKELQKRLTDVMLEREIVMATRPQSDRVLVSDATSEALAEFLEEHHERALVADPEGGVFDHALGSSGNRAPRLDTWLKSYGGETIDERRVGNAINPRSKGRYVKSPLVSVAVATQPKALGALFSNELAGAKGFLARFLTVIVPPELPEEFIREGLLPSDLVDAWSKAVHRLLGGIRPSEPIDVALSEPARALFVDWGQGELGAAHAGNEDDAADYLSAWNAKFRGKALRLALTLHALGTDVPGATPIDEETMQAALAWLPYFQGHNTLIADVLREDPDLLVAERVLSWLDVRQLSGESFTRGSLFKGLKGGNTTAVRRVDDLNGALGVLSDSGWLRPVGRPEPRRNGVAAARRYDVHPALGEHLAQHRAAEADLNRTLGRRGL